MSIFETAKTAANVLKEAGKINEYQQILELLDKLLDLQKRNADLELENKNLKEKLVHKGKLLYKNNCYWDGGDGPFCSRCWEKNWKLLRMHPVSFESPRVKCPECKTIVNSSGEKININSSTNKIHRSLNPYRQ